MLDKRQWKTDLPANEHINNSRRSSEINYQKTEAIYIQLNGCEILIKIRVNVMDPIVWFCDGVDFITLKTYCFEFCFVSTSREKSSYSFIFHKTLGPTSNNCSQFS